MRKKGHVVILTVSSLHYSFLLFVSLLLLRFLYLRGRDRLDYIKGIPQKLLAFEDLLQTRPEWQGKVVLFQVCLPPSETVSRFYPSENTQELHSQINEYVVSDLFDKEREKEEEEREKKKFSI